MNAYKFEIERLDKQVNSVKELYFNTKQKQVIYGIYSHMPFVPSSGLALTWR